MNITKIKTSRGFTVIELLIAVTISAFIIVGGFSGFRAYQSRSRIQQTLRSITSAFNTARYRAIEDNRSVKVTIQGSTLLLLQSSSGDWQELQRFYLEQHVDVDMNASPVFTPAGSVAPLCSVYVRSEHYIYKITLSIAGRLKTVRLRD
jgi:prepilin-type N-terminal cleavage/methylation domain-containing protein